MKKALPFIIAGIVLLIGIGTFAAVMVFNVGSKDTKITPQKSSEEAASALIPLYDTASEEVPATSEQEISSDYQNFDEPVPTTDEPLGVAEEGASTITGILVHMEGMPEGMDNEMRINSLKESVDRYIHFYNPEISEEYHAYYVEGTYWETSAAFELGLAVKDYYSPGQDLYLHCSNNLDCRMPFNITSDLTPDGTWELVEYTSITGLHITKPVSTY